MSNATLKREYNSKDEDILNSFQTLEVDKARLSEKRTPNSPIKPAGKTKPKKNTKEENAK